MKREGKVTGFMLGGLLLISTAGAAQVSVTSSAQGPEAFTPMPPSSINLVVNNSSRSTRNLTDDAVSAFPDAPSAVARSSAEQDPATVPVSAVQPPSPPKVQAPANTTVGSTFLIANGLLLGSTILNAEMISRCRPSACQAVPDAIRNRGDLYGIGIPSSLAVSYISYRLKRSGTRMWILPVAVLTAGNIIYAAHAAQYSNPSSVATPAARKR